MSNGERGPINVFISHKNEDRDTALFLHRKLELYGAGKVSCFVSENIPYGQDWFEEIRKALARTDVLVLIFTMTDASWDWPLYEVGLATDLEAEDRCRVVCLHAPNSKPPEPIKYAQAVRGDAEGLEDFLIEFFCGTDITGGESAINPGLAQDDRAEIRQLAGELAGHFTAVDPWSHCFTNFLWVEVDDVPLESEEVPVDSRILEGSSALDMFRFTQGPPGRNDWMWGDLLQKVGRSGDAAWIRDLGERFYWASRGEILKTTRSTFRCMKTDKLYRPFVHRVDLQADGSMRFEVIFVRHLEGDGETT